MMNQSASSALKSSHASPILACRIKIPEVLASSPGRFHSILQDKSGTLYGTDEMNHRVFAIANSGQLLWTIGHKGSEDQAFWYPKGLAFGSIQLGNSSIPCLAACDSWNHRIQHFDLRGNFLTQWNRSGGKPFGDLVDIRFLVQEGTGDSTSGVWFVLDRQNHCLHLIDPEGRRIGQIGEGLPPILESKWAKQIIGSVWHTFAHFPNTLELPFAPLYHPDRILECKVGSILIQQPDSFCIKKALATSILDIAQLNPEEGDCIAANDTMVLRWHPATGVFRLQDYDRKTYSESQIAGYPVFSALPPNEFWVVHREELLRYQWPHSQQAPEDASTKALTIAAHEAQEVIEHPELKNQFKEIEIMSQSCLALGNEVLKIGQDYEPSEPQLDFFRGQSERVRNSAIPAIKQSIEQIDIPAKTAILSLHAPWLCKSPDADIIAALAQAWTLWIDSIESSFFQLLNCIDSLALRRAFLEKHKSNLPKLYDTVSTGESLLLQSALPLQNWLLGPLGYLANLKENALLAKVEKPRPSYRLREVNRFALVNAPGSLPIRPYGIAETQDGHLYVALLGMNAVAHLDADGQVLPLLAEGKLKGPVGITVDDQGRLWITERYGHRVTAVNPATEGVETIFGQDRTESRLFAPIGICRNHAGHMLVADSGNSRIIRVFPSGVIESYCEGPVAASGQLLQPLSLCAESNRGEGTWIADVRRHEVILLDASGRFVRKVGGCGLRNGRLIMPQAVASFPDGILAVTQNQLDRSLILLSPQGEELFRMPLDFIPSGLLASGKKLFISEYDGIHVRVFERICQTRMSRSKVDIASLFLSNS